MVKIKIHKGLDIPIKGKPENDVVLPFPNLDQCKEIALDLSSFNLRIHPLVKVGDRVKIGEPLAEDKFYPRRKFASPASGVISEIRRGLKRAITYIVIHKDASEEYFSFEKIDPSHLSPSALIEALCERGIFAKIGQRPLNVLANPNILPKAIFVKAVESAPFVPPAEMQVKGHEKDFQTGLDALSRLAPVHLVFRENSTFQAFTEAKHVHSHTVEGPHPVANSSLHIQKIAPISSVEDIIWTLNAHDVISIGHVFNEGKALISRVVSIAGPGILPERTGYFRLREGYPIAPLISDRLENTPARLISGDPLNGHHVDINAFLGFSSFAFTVVPENTERQFLHFFRLGMDKYSFSRAYLTGHLNNTNRSYDFTTSLHGEHRPFIDSTLIDQVQPLDIPTMHLVKAVMAEDFDSAEAFGLLEVAPEDFALPTFVCPSKVEMVDIIYQGQLRYAKDLGT